MAWSPNTPLSIDIPAQSQALIQGNFQYLDATLIAGINNSTLLARQAAAPAVAATQIGIYNLLTGGGNALVIKNGVGAEVDITTAGKIATGWCKLPCGIIMKWGTSVERTALGTFVTSLAALPAINTILMVLLTLGPATTGGVISDTQTIVSYESFTVATQEVTWKAGRSNAFPAGHGFCCKILAIGI